MKKEKYIMAIVGPKGGVGKTTIAANLAIALTRHGKKVIAVDLDLGAANLHSIFGLRETKFTLNDFVMNRVKNLSDIVLDSSIANLKIICGGDVPGIANLHYQRKLKLIRHLSLLESDIVLLDLGAGASYNVVDFLIIAQEGLLVTTPEVPSLLNAYSFIKTLIYRQFAFHFKRTDCPELLDLLEKAKDFEANPHLKTMEGFLQEAKKIDPEGADAAKRILRNFRPIVVVNRVLTKNDANAGNVVRKLMSQYLSIESSVIMTIREDQAVKNAIARLKPVMIDPPRGSVFSQDINHIAGMLCGLQPRAYFSSIRSLTDISYSP